MKLPRSTKQKSALNEGYVLIDALFSIVIISIFIVALAGLYSSLTSFTLKAEARISALLTEQKNNIESMKLFYYEE